MTSLAPVQNQIHLVTIQDVIVKDARQRSDMGDLEGLAESILKNGLLNPIILQRADNSLIAGERRLEAYRMNGELVIPATYRDELDPIQLEQLELEENIRRKQLTWAEEQRAVAKIHKLRMSQDPNWTQGSTAILIQKPDAAAPQQRDVSEALLLDKMMVLFPEIAQAKSKAQAINMAKSKAKNVNRRLDVAQKPEVYAEVQEKIWLGNSLELIKNIPDGVIDAHITDPPFGIDYDAHVAGTVGEASSYEDTTEMYEKEVLAIIPDLYRTLKPDGWVVWFFGMSWYERVKTEFRKAGFTVDEIPIIWDRSEGRCFTNVPSHYFTKAYDVALHAFKGDPHLVQKNKPNIIRVKPVDSSSRSLVVERPVELYAELIRRMTIPGQLVADMFAGSGSCPAAAAMLKRDYIACERAPDRHAVAVQKVKAHIPS